MTMKDDVEAFIRARCHEMPGEQAELFVTDDELMLATGISLAEARFADAIGDVEIMELVRNPRLLDQGAHPRAAGEGVRGEIQDDGHTGSQQRHQMRRHPMAEASRIAHIVGKACLFAGIEPGKPLILGHDDGVRKGGESGGERRFSGGDLAAQEMQRRFLR